jgi:flavin reductase (DIM6/NTAB) family NADH-FMN oxidoreductase RutF
MSNSISDAQRLSSPNPFCLVTSCDQEGRSNIMAVSWWTYVSNKPATVAICVSQKSYTYALINQNHEFGLCVVDKSLNPAAFQCGTSSGREVKKAESYGIQLINSEKIKPKIISAHRVALECGVIRSFPVHDHVMLIAGVLQIHLNPDTHPLFALDGYRRLGVVHEEV